MPLASEAHAPTYSWIQRTSQLTEFALLKDSVKKLERASREQLLLENESQGAFDHLSGEVATLKEAVSALSQVVDGELASLREDMAQIRKEMKQTIAVARKEADSASQAVADSQRAAQALVEMGVAQLKEHVGRVENDVHTARAQHLELAQQQAAASAAAAAGTEGARVEARQALAAVEGRVAATEGLTGRLRAELDETLRHEHREVVTWSAQAREQLAKLRSDVDGTGSLVAEARTRLSELGEASAGHAAAAAEAAADVGRQRDAIGLLVSGLNEASAGAKQRSDELETRVGSAEAAAEAFSRAQSEHDRASDEAHKRAGEALAALEAKCTKLHEEGNTAKHALSRHADRLQGLEDDSTSLRRAGSEATASLRQMKSGLKEVSDGLSAHKRDARRTHDALDSRCEAYDDAIGTIAEHLKIPNPVAAALGAAAAAL